jgi:hypothetical protein
MHSLILLFLLSYANGGFLFYTTNTEYVTGFNPALSNGQEPYIITVPVYSGSTTPSIVAIDQQVGTNNLWMLDAGSVTFQGFIIYDLITGVYTVGGTFPGSWQSLNGQMQGIYVDPDGLVFGNSHITLRDFIRLIEDMHEYMYHVLLSIRWCSR